MTSSLATNGFIKRETFLRSFSKNNFIFSFVAKLYRYSKQSHCNANNIWASTYVNDSMKKKGRRVDKDFISCTIITGLRKLHYTYRKRPRYPK